MVQRSGALHIIGRSLPIVMKGPTPDSEVADFHDDIGGQDIAGGDLDHKGLSKVLRKAPVEKKQTAFCSPLYSAHTLFDKEDCF